MKTIISPSILGGSFSNMEKTISELDQSKAEYIHFDVMDGDFVPNLTFGPQFISNLRTKTKKIFDVHLMINRVNKFLDDYIKAGSNIITFHYEINEDLNKLIDKIKQNKISFLKDSIQKIEEWKNMKAPEWFNNVGVNYPELEKEKWEFDDSYIKQMADEAYKKQKKRQKEYRQKKGGKGNR